MTASTASLRLTDSEPHTHLATLARQRRRLLFALSALLVLAAFASLALGPVSIPLGDVLAHLLTELGLDLGAPAETAPFVALRLSRTLLGIGLGAALGLAGATLQGLFRNPLADPGLIGVSSGARLGATAFIVLGGASWVAASPFAAFVALPIAAWLGAIATMSAVRLLALRSGATHIAVLLLAGLAMTAFEEAVVGLLTAIADDEALRAATLWRLGSLQGATLGTAALVLGVTAIGAMILLPLGRSLDALTLGEAEAHHLGIRVERMKRILVLVAALVVATATAFAGVIGFVGLVVPHIVRLVAGPSHRTVLPASLIGGALLVLIADLIARTIAAPSELPLGVITALLGAPFLLALVVRRSHA